MTKRARYSRDIVAFGAILVSGAFAAACEGGPGTLDPNGLQTYQPPPSDGSYGQAVDDGPPVTDGLGGPSTGLPAPPAGGGLPPDNGIPGGGQSCGQILSKFEACVAGLGGGFTIEEGDRAEFLSGCASAPAGCRSCIGALDCNALFKEGACEAQCGDGLNTDPGPVGGAGGSSSGKGGSGGGGGTNGGNGTCAQVVGALLACPDLGIPSSAVAAISAQCEPYSGACKACIAALSCDDLAVVAGEQGPEGSKCASSCSGGGTAGTGGTGGSSSGKGGSGGTGGSGSGKGGTGGTGGSGGTGGTGGSSSSGDCVDDLVAKGDECGQTIPESSAISVCEQLPACASCVIAAPCDSPEDICDAACGQ